MSDLNSENLYFQNSKRPKTHGRAGSEHLKVGEVFLCGPETKGELKVLPQFLGKAITGLGGGSKLMYVI